MAGIPAPRGNGLMAAGSLRDVCISVGDSNAKRGRTDHSSAWRGRLGRRRVCGARESISQMMPPARGYALSRLRAFRVCAFLFLCCVPFVKPTLPHPWGLSADVTPGGSLTAQVWVEVLRGPIVPSEGASTAPTLDYEGPAARSTSSLSPASFSLQ